MEVLTEVAERSGAIDEVGVIPCLYNVLWLFFSFVFVVDLTDNRLKTVL